MRRQFGIRMKMIQLRTALFAEADKFDPEAFCWTGRAQPRPEEASQDRPGDHLVNVLAAQIGREGTFDIDSLMATYKEWTTLPPPVHPEPEAPAADEPAS